MSNPEFSNKYNDPTLPGYDPSKPTGSDSQRSAPVANDNLTPKSDQKMKSECKGYAMIAYVGGHKAWPKPVNTMIFVYDDRMEIGPSQEKTVLAIPYSDMISMENMDEKKISAERVVGLGLVFVPLAIVGAVWKKRHIYTVIRYKEELDEQTIVLDFEGNIEKFQPFIYRKMLDCRKK